MLCPNCQKLEVTLIKQTYDKKANSVVRNYKCSKCGPSITQEKFKSLKGSEDELGFTIRYEEDPILLDPRNKKLGARLVINLEKLYLSLNKLDLKSSKLEEYYNLSFDLGILQNNTNKLKDKIFGIECNFEELNAINFKKGCYVGQENTSRIKLRNKLRRRILPVKKIVGEIAENDIIKYKGSEIGKVIISTPYSFALVKVVEPDLNEFTNTELICGASKVKILKPEWI